jgi:single-stranded-DNA-specific exonuclease
LIERQPPDPRAAVHDLGFALGPRINAGGRVGKSDLGVRLLTTRDDEEARGIAAELDRFNEERRAIEAMVQEQAELLAERQAQPCTAAGGGAGWHPGVIGIVAGRIKEKIRQAPRSSSRWTDEAGGMAKARAARSPGSIWARQIIAAKDSGLLAAGGGHAMAAGLTVDADRIEELHAFLDDRLAVDIAQAKADRMLLLDSRSRRAASIRRW